jgi:hypothetical protein
MSAEELEYKRAALQILSSILGELVRDFSKTLTDQWEQEGRPGISPIDRRYPLDELSKMATEWLRVRNNRRRRGRWDSRVRRRVA